LPLASPLGSNGRAPTAAEHKGGLNLAQRIYSLAKELNLDSKELVELCPKAGVHGKGSALASLTDDEVTKLRSYLDSGSSRAAVTPARPVAQAPRPVRTLPSTAARKARTVREEAEAAALEEGAAVAVAVDTPPVEGELPPSPAVGAAPSAAPLGVATEPPSEAHPDAGSAPVAPLSSATAPPIPRGPLLAGSNQGQLRNLAARVRKREPGKRPADGRGEGGPVIRVAAMPEVKQPPVKAKQPSEPAPQKPDIKLPLDAIRSAKSGGGGALRDRVKELEERKKKSDTKKKTDSLLGRLTLGQETPGTGRARRGRGADGAEEAEPITPEKRRRKRQRRDKGEGEDGGDARDRRQIKRTGRNTAAERKTAVVVELPCTVTSFAQAVGRSVGDVLRVLLQLGVGVMNKNAAIDRETAELLAGELGVTVEFKRAFDAETALLEQFQTTNGDAEHLQPRPPVVTFLGHVDHGKTSLLDRILHLKVAEGEAGGITQHIRAYRVENDGRPIAFVDTPGHEAFTEMRARGANVTDVAVLVVAADDGVMPQTEEALSHARAANVPIVVALNKVDLYGIDVNRVMQQLAAKGLLPSEWGGDVEVIKCSAHTGQGIDELLNTLLTIAELHNYRANPQSAATGTCLEAERHEGRGVVAKLMVQNGTLKVGDTVVCGAAYGRVKAMYDTINPRLKHEEALPSTPVNVTGLDEVPNAGERFYVMDDIAKAREVAQTREARSRATGQRGFAPHVTLAGLRQRLEEGQQLFADEVASLHLVLRADTRGSIEAIEKELTKLDHPEVKIKVLQSLVGGVSEADVHLADASDAIIIAFNVVPDEKARALAQDRGVEIRRYDIIYRVTEDLKAALEGMLKPEERERELGAAWVQKVFHISRVGAIAGCRVMRGTIRREAQVRMRIIRENTIIGDYPLESLRREKDDAREVREGLECGIKLAGFDDLKEGDVLEAYKIEEVARTL
jgi:translation initiation factor IF-2